MPLVFVIDFEISRSLAALRGEKAGFGIADEKSIASGTVKPSPPTYLNYLRVGEVAGKGERVGDEVYPSESRPVHARPGLFCRAFVIGSVLGSLGDHPTANECRSAGEWQVIGRSQ